MKSRLLTLVSAVLLSTGVSATPITFDMVWKWKSGSFGEQDNLTGSLQLEDSLLVSTLPPISLTKDNLTAFSLDFPGFTALQSPWGSNLELIDFLGSEAINLTFNDLSEFFIDRTSEFISGLDPDPMPKVNLEIIKSNAGVSHPYPNGLNIADGLVGTFDLISFKAKASSLIAPIPEPQTLALFGLGLLGLLGRRKRQP